MYVCTSYCMSVCNHPSKWVGMQHIIGIMTQIDNFFKICANHIILLYIFIEYIVHIYAYVRCDLRSFQTSYTKAIFPSKPGRLAWSINCQSVKVYLHYSNLSNLSWKGNFVFLCLENAAVSRIFHVFLPGQGCWLDMEGEKRPMASNKAHWSLVKLQWKSNLICGFWSWLRTRQSSPAGNLNII